jgi:ribosome maturation factor RimP
VLEVSSGGMARPLTEKNDFQLFEDSKIKVVLKDKFIGKKKYSGFLRGVDKNGDIILETEENEIKINFLEIEKANIDPDWAIEYNQTK